MKRSPIIRKKPMKHRPPSRDRVTPEVYAAARLRDGGCLGPLAGMPTLCAGPIEIDHVRVGGMGLRSPSVKENLGCLCQLHHRMKTEDGRTWRPRLLALIDPSGTSDVSAETGSPPTTPSPS